MNMTWNLVEYASIWCLALDLLQKFYFIVQHYCFIELHCYGICCCCCLIAVCPNCLNRKRCSVRKFISTPLPSWYRLTVAIISYISWLDAKLEIGSWIFLTEFENSKKGFEIWKPNDQEEQRLRVESTPIFKKVIKYLWIKKKQNYIAYYNPYITVVKILCIGDV